MFFFCWSDFCRDFYFIDLLQSVWITTHFTREHILRDAVVFSTCIWGKLHTAMFLGALRKPLENALLDPGIRTVSWGIRRVVASTEGPKSKDNTFQEPQENLVPPAFVRRDTDVHAFVCVGVAFWCKRQERRQFASDTSAWQERLWVASTAPRRRNMRRLRQPCPRREHHVNVWILGKAPFFQRAFLPLQG